jgi:hypothetical protein
VDVEIVIGLLGLVFAAVVLVDVWALRRRPAATEDEPDDEMYAVLHLPPGASG